MHVAGYDLDTGWGYVDGLAAVETAESTPTSIPTLSEWAFLALVLALALAGVALLRT